MLSLERIIEAENVAKEIEEYEDFCRNEYEMEILCVTEDFTEKNMTRRNRRRHREIVRMTRPHAKKKGERNMLDWMSYEVCGTYVPTEICDAYGEYMESQPYRDGMEMRMFFDEEDYDE